MRYVYFNILLFEFNVFIFFQKLQEHYDDNYRISVAQMKCSFHYSALVVVSSLKVKSEVCTCYHVLITASLNDNISYIMELVIN